MASFRLCSRLSDFQAIRSFTSLAELLSQLHNTTPVDLATRGLASDIIPLLKKLGLGVAAGAGTTILGDVLGGGDSSSAPASTATPASKRDFEYVSRPHL